MELWSAIALGAVGGAGFLAATARLRAEALAIQGFVALTAMLAIYVGARLVSGSLGEVILETIGALVVLGVVQVAMRVWPPAVGLVIFAHGLYDAILGSHTGVASWYPPLCAGFDFVVGTGITALLMRKAKGEAARKD